MDRFEANRIRAARELLLAGRVEEAGRISRELLQGSSTLLVLLLAADLAEAKGEFETALEFTSKAQALHGESAPILLKRAQALMHLRRRAEGVATAHRAAAICPPDASLLRAI